MNKSKLYNTKSYFVLGICSVVFSLTFVIVIMAANTILSSTEYEETKNNTTDVVVQLNKTSTVINKFRVEGMYFLVIDDTTKDMPYNMEVTKEQYDNTEYTIKKEE